MEAYNQIPAKVEYVVFMDEILIVRISLTGSNAGGGEILRSRFFVGIARFAGTVYRDFFGIRRLYIVSAAERLTPT